MSENEKPLHVAVAEALGEPCRFKDGWWERLEGSVWTAAIPRYDTSWESTGPLIEKYRIDIYRTSLWNANASGFGGSGQAPLLAVCALILALKEAGKPLQREAL